MIDWKYVYKRRSWTVLIVVKGLPELTFEAFKDFHTQRGITCPPESDFDEAAKSLVPPPDPKPDPVPELKVKQVRKSRSRRTTQRKTQEKSHDSKIRGSRNSTS